MDSLICLRALWDRVAAWAFIVGGGLLVLDAGQHARNAVYVANSLSFLTSGGISGLAAVVIGCTLLVSAGFHDEWRKLDRIEATLVSKSGSADDPASPGRWLRAESDRAAGWTLVVGAGVWLAIGSRLVAGALYAPKQVAYVISGGVGPFAVLLAGLTVLLAADMRDEERKLDRIAVLLPAAESTCGDGPVRNRRILRALTGVSLLAGGLFVVAGWWRAADALHVDRALDGLLWSVVGTGAIGAVLVGITARRRGRLAGQARRVLGRLSPRSSEIRAGERHRNGADHRRWTAEGLHHIHLAACPVLAGIDSERRTPVPVGSGLEPCLLCDDGE